MQFRRSVGALPFLLFTSIAVAQTRPHNFHLVDVRWHVDLKTYEDTEVLNGDVVNTLTLLHDPSKVAFDCAKLHVQRVEVNGKPAAFTTDEKMVSVQLPNGTKVGQTVKIHVYYDGKPGAGIYLVPAARAFPAHTNVIYTQGEMEDNRYWLPTWDYPDDKATSEGFIEVGKGETAISNGKLIEVQDKPDRSIFHWKMDQPHATYLISIVAGKYDEGKGFWGAMPVNYYAPEGLLDWGTAAFGGTEKIIDFYSKLTGFNYPYAKFCQSAVPDYMFGGMENITAVTQTINALHPQSVNEVQDSTGLVAHELAHQWFGDTVTCNGWSDAWLNEGFATFLPNFWEREKHGDEAYSLGRYGDFQGGLAAHQGDHRPVVWKGYKDALDMFNNFIYPGGASRMFMLMDQLGEAKFWKAISSYLNERKYTSVDTPMFFQSMSKAAGVDLTAFMQQWFYTPAAPDLTVNVRASKLVVSQPQPYFDLNLDVWILNGDAWVPKKLHLTGAEATLDLGDLTGKPVLIDPRCFVMANIKNNIPYTPFELEQLFNHAPNAGEKARIMDSMMSSLKPEDWLSFAKTVKSHRLLERMLDRVSTDAESFLINLTSDSDRGLANTALGALERQPSSGAIILRLRDLAANDPDDVIKQHATRVLINFTNDQALVDKAWITDGFQDGYRQMALQWLFRNKPDIAREKCLDLLAHPSAEPTRVQAISMLGDLKDKPGDLRVYKALLAVLKETSFGARSNAIGSLAKYGDAAAIPYLEPYLTHSLVFFRQGAAGAIASLRASK
jgi:aminopeptidase N